MNSRPLLDKAEKFIQTAKVLIEIEDFDSATSRLYYAMFYVASELLDSIALSYSSHHAVISAYGQHFAKTRQLDPRFHRALIQAFDLRQLSDYSPLSGLARDTVEELLSDSQDFLQTAHTWLNQKPEN